MSTPARRIAVVMSSKLNPEHSKGGPNADWFNQARFTRENAADLEKQS
jgi:hypothetical protein